MRKSPWPKRKRKWRETVPAPRRLLTKMIPLQPCLKKIPIQVINPRDCKRREETHQMEQPLKRPQQRSSRNCSDNFLKKESTILLNSGFFESCLSNTNANAVLKEGSGASTAIFEAAGRRKLAQACKKIGSCPVGSAVSTLAFNLKAKYIIHRKRLCQFCGFHI